MAENCVKSISISDKAKTLLKMHYSNSKQILDDIKFDTYIVRPNDTIESVAALFKMTPSKLFHINKLSMRTLLVNQKLKVFTIKEEESNTNDKKKIIDSFKVSSPESADFLEQLSISCNSESELFPVHYKDNYIKVNVKYITDTEGIIKGKLLLTPVSLTFNPAFKDPVVQEYGIDQFMIHLPNSKIACVSMYTDSNAMTYIRSQRTLCRQIHPPVNHEIFFTCQHSLDEEKSPNDFETVHTRKLSLISEDLSERESNKSHANTSNDGNHYQLKQLTDNNYLCVIASPRYRKTKAIYQKEDEYWFIVPASSTETVLNYLSSKTEYDTGANVDPQKKWIDEKNDVSGSLNQKKMVRNPSFSKINRNDPDHSSFVDAFGLIREKSMDWEIINNDFDLLTCQNSIYDDSQFSDSDILNSEQLKELINHVPKEAFGAKWDLIYATYRDGWSLQTLYRNVFDSTRNACILIIRDLNHNVFGAICNTYIRMSRSFYGNGLTVLFRWNPNFEKFKCVQNNNYILFGDPKYFVIGSSNCKHAIRINSSLFNGITQACETFNSPPLVKSESFQISSVEVWSFY